MRHKNGQKTAQNRHFSAKFSPFSGKSPKSHLQPFRKFQRLQEINASIEGSRLVREDTLCADSMGEKERKKLRQKRTGKARHWNLLTDMEAKGAR